MTPVESPSFPLVVGRGWVPVPGLGRCLRCACSWDEIRLIGVISTMAEERHRGNFPEHRELDVEDAPGLGRSRDHWADRAHRPRSVVADRGASRSEPTRGWRETCRSFLAP